LRKLDRYVGATVALTLLFASLGLIGLFVVFTFMDQLEDLKNDYTIFAAASYIGYSVPRIFFETTPYAALIGCLAGLGLLANSSELIVMRTAGISTWRISWWAMKPALVLVMAGLLVGESILPEFERTAQLIRESAMEEDITPQGGFWYREGNTYMHFNKVSSAGHLEGIHQYVTAPDGRLQQTLWAESARYRPGHGNWALHETTATELTEDVSAGDDRVRHWQTTLTPELLSTEILVEPDKMSISELYDKIRHLEAHGQNTGKFELGLWTKLFQPLASLSLVFTAISFVFGPLREATTGMRVVSGLIVGILFKFVQDLLSPASLVFGFSPVLATLTPIAICFLIGTVLLRRAN